MNDPQVNMWFKQNLRPFQCLFAGQFTSCQQAPRSQDIGFSVLQMEKLVGKGYILFSSVRLGAVVNLEETLCSPHSCVANPVHCMLYFPVCKSSGTLRFSHCVCGIKFFSSTPQSSTQISSGPPANGGI